MNGNKPAATTLKWFKSSYSSNNGACVEAAHGIDTMVIRDSKVLDGPSITLPGLTAQAFIRAIKAGKF
ncbi:DUF397 domain-containing protein [Streptomyces sp. NPDC051162]|uniref:DUF397 domain-containing protein n=1 Tax=Streptomyces sp. NPDC051162 TaxID=3154747 RepID=UPI00343FA890